MTTYERLINLAEKCEQKAQNENNCAMQAFYRNAAEGFRTKANSLTIEEAERHI